MEKTKTCKGIQPEYPGACVHIDAHCSGCTPAAELRTLAGELAAVLRDAVRWVGTNDPFATFEDIAQWFYQETGCIRPGKDVPPGMHQSEERRGQAWALWSTSKRKEIRDKAESVLAREEKVQ